MRAISDTEAVRSGRGRTLHMTPQVPPPLSFSKSQGTSQAAIAPSLFRGAPQHMPHPAAMTCKVHHWQRTEVSGTPRVTDGSLQPRPHKPAGHVADDTQGSPHRPRGHAHRLQSPRHPNLSTHIFNVFINTMLLRAEARRPEGARRGHLGRAGSPTLDGKRLEHVVCTPPWEVSTHMRVTYPALSAGVLESERHGAVANL